MNHIGSLKYKDCHETSDVDEMSLIAQNFFQELFTSGCSGEMENILYRVQNCISS